MVGSSAPYFNRAAPSPKKPQAHSGFGDATSHQGSANHQLQDELQSQPLPLPAAVSAGSSTSTASSYVTVISILHAITMVVVIGLLEGGIIGKPTSSMSPLVYFLTGAVALLSTLVAIIPKRRLVLWLAVVADAATCSVRMSLLLIGSSSSGEDQAVYCTEALLFPLLEIGLLYRLEQQLTAVPVHPKVQPDHTDSQQISKRHEKEKETASVERRPAR